SRSKSNNSIAAALREKTLKLTQPLTIVAPSGELCPGVKVGGIAVWAIWICLNEVPTPPLGCSFNPQCGHPAKPECSGTRIGNWFPRGCCTPAGLGFGLACAGLAGCGS